MFSSVVKDKSYCWQGQEKNNRPEFHAINEDSFSTSARALWRKALRQGEGESQVSIMVLAAMLLASLGVRPQNDCRSRVLPQLRGDNHIIARSHGPACLEAINAGHIAKQGIRIAQGRPPDAQGGLSCGSGQLPGGRQDRTCNNFIMSRALVFWPAAGRPVGFLKRVFAKPELPGFFCSWH